MIVRRDGGLIAAPPGAATAVQLIRNLLYRGFGPDEAGNLVGLAFGLRPTHGGWSGREIDHLRFVREATRSTPVGPLLEGLRAGGGLLA
jgi:hypothetical protein